MTLGAGQMPQQPLQMPQPQLAQQPSGGPPAAPTGPAAPSTAYNEAAYREALRPYTNVASTGGPPPASLTAQATSGPTAARSSEPQPVASASGEIKAPAPVLSNADTASLTAAEQTARNSDKPAQNVTIGGLNWQWDPEYKRYFLAAPGTQSTLTEQRFYMGKKGYEEYPLAESQMRQNLRTIRDSGTVPSFAPTDEETKTWPIEKVKAELLKAQWYKNTGGSASDPIQAKMDSILEQIKQINRGEDIINSSPNTWEYSSEAANRDANWQKIAPLLGDQSNDTRGFKNRLTGALMLGWPDTAGEAHPLSIDMRTTMAKLAADMRAEPAVGIPHTSGLITEAQPGFEAKAGAQIPTSAGWIPVNVGVTQGGVPAQDNPLNIPFFQKLTAAGTKQEQLALLEQQKADLKAALNSEVENATLHNLRVHQNTRDANATLANEPGKDYLPDSGNTYRDFKTGRLKTLDEVHPPPPQPTNFVTSSQIAEGIKQGKTAEQVIAEKQSQPIITNKAEMDEFKKQHKQGSKTRFTYINPVTKESQEYEW